MDWDLTSVSERYINSQFENIMSRDPSEKFKFEDVTSAQLNVTFL